MTERPIIFSGPMVRAILAGRKTQTRRLAHVPPRVWLQIGDAPPEPRLADSLWTKVQPGDRLWVREMWCQRSSSQPDGCWYAADGTHVVRDDGGGWPVLRKDGSEASAWRPSIHMPRWASRITLEVMEVRRQRLQEIDEVDAVAEGMKVLEGGFYVAPENGEGKIAVGDNAYRMFSRLWDTLHAKPGSTWADNPEVVAITFGRLP